MIEFGELRQKLALILLHLGPDGAEFCLHQVFQLAAQFSKPGVHVRPARRRSGRLDSHFARYSRPRRRSGSTSDPLRWRRTVARSYAACLQSTRFCGSVGARHSIQSIGRAEATPSHSLCASTLPHRGAAIANISQEVRYKAMKAAAVFFAALATMCAQVPNPTQQQPALTLAETGQPMPIFRVTVVSRTISAINYHQIGRAHV